MEQQVVTDPGVAPDGGPARPQGHDLVLRNARVLDLATGAVGAPRDLGIRAGVLVDDAVSGAEEVDLAGRLVMPGLWDGHVHMVQWSLFRARVDLSSADSAEQCLALLSEHDGGDELLVGQGFRDATWPSLPDEDMVHRVLGDRAAVAISADLHSAWVTGAARRLLGLPEGSVRLVEGAAFALEELVSQRQQGQVEELVADACREASGRGVVGITDMEMTWSGPAWCERSHSGDLGLRVRPAVYPWDLAAVLATGVRSGEVLDDRGLVTMGPLKAIVDGSLTARTAWISAGYPDAGAGEHGIRSIEPAELQDMLARCAQGGLECAVHAIGDAALAMVLDAFEATGARGSVEHAQLAPADSRRRMARLPLVASVQPSHLVDDVGAMERLWPSSTADAFPLRALLDEGVPLRLGSDAPVARLDPWQAIADAVLREGPSGVWHGEQRISLSEALVASTDSVVAPRAGGPADLCVLEENPFEVPAERLRLMRSWLTVVGGRVVHALP